MKNRFGRLAATAVVGLALASSAQASSVLTIDPDGAGAQGAIQVGVLDWNVGNSLVQNIDQNPALPPTTTLAQSNLSSFNNASSVPIGGTGLNSTYEWTYVLGVQQTVQQALVFGSLATQLTTVAGGDNFFKIYYDPARNSSPLAGTGFADGTLILQGVIQPGGVANFTAFADINKPGNTNALDQFGTNNYPGINSVTGVGGGTLDIRVTFFNPAFFPTSPNNIVLNFTTQQVLPYAQTDPSALFTNGSGAAVPGVASVGTCNGCLEETAPNVMVQVDANTSFNAPEPGSVALLGLGLGALSTISALRRRRNSK